MGTWWISGLDDLLAVARRIQYRYGDAVAQAVTASLASHQSIEGPFDNPRLIADRCPSGWTGPLPRTLSRFSLAAARRPGRSGKRGQRRPTTRCAAAPA